MDKKVSVMVECPYCKGEGRVKKEGSSWPDFCQPCGGSGRREGVINPDGSIVAKAVE